MTESVVESAGGKSGGYLCPAGRLEVLQSQQPAVQVGGLLVVADLRQFAAIVEATQEKRLLQPDPEDRARHAAHDRNRLLVGADVVVAADDLVADTGGGQREQGDQGCCE